MSHENDEEEDTHVVRLQIWSDLHLEYNKEDEPLVDPNADVLILAGDIGQGEMALPFIKKQLAASPTVQILYVLGNHEFHHHVYENVREFWAKVKLDRLFVLDNETVTLHGIHFLGCTLWSDFATNHVATKRRAQRSVHDYTRIQKRANYLRNFERASSNQVPEIPTRRLTVDDTIQHHKEALSWLNRELYAIGKKDDDNRPPVVVVTHHLPTFNSISDDFANWPLNGAFASHLDYLFKRHRIDIWIHGHVHCSKDYMLNKTRIICNARGFVRNGVVQNPRFNSALIINVEKRGETMPATDTTKCCGPREGVRIHEVVELP